MDELLRTDNPNKEKTKGLLKQMPDLEKGLSRIHYGQVNRKKRTTILHINTYIIHKNNLTNCNIIYCFYIVITKRTCSST